MVLLTIVPVHILQSGVWDMRSPSSSMHSLSVENLPPTSSVSNLNANVKLDLAFKHIKELREEVHEVRKEIHEVHKEIQEIKEEVGRLVERQTTREQQLFGAVNNVDMQLHCIMQSLPPARRDASELGSMVSVYHTCPQSQRSSSDPEPRQHISELLPLEAARIRRHSLPTPLHLPTDSKLQIVDWQTASILRDKLEHITEEPMDPSTQVRQISTFSTVRSEQLVLV